MKLSRFTYITGVLMVAGGTAMEAFSIGNGAYLVGGGVLVIIMALVIHEAV